MLSVKEMLLYSQDRRNCPSLQILFSRNWWSVVLNSSRFFIKFLLYTPQLTRVKENRGDGGGGGGGDGGGDGGGGDGGDGGDGDVENS